MIPYIVMLFAPFSCYFIRYWSTKRKTRASVSIFFVILLILLIFRNDSMGSDIEGYRFYFNTFSTYRFNQLPGVDSIFYSDIEPFFVYFNWLVSRISNSFRIYIAIVSAVSVFPIFMWYRKEFEDYGLGISMFLAAEPIVFYVSGIRQGIALAFVPFVYYTVKKKKKWSFIFIVLIATLFHFSAFIMILMYPVYYAKIDRRRFAYFLSFSGLIFLFKKYLYRVVFSTVTSCIGKLNKYSADPETTGAYFYALFLFLLLIYCYEIVDEKQLNDDSLGMRNFLLLSFVIQMFSSISSIIMRFNYYYLMFLPISIPRILKKGGVNGRFLSVSAKAITIFLYMLFFVKCMLRRGSTAHYFPYIFMWND